MEEKTIISIKKGSCKVGHRHLVRDIDWEVKAGEHWAVFGMNGSGKTTLLSVIAGFRHFSSGKLEVFGKQVSNETIMENRKRIGWVSASFFDRLYSRENALDIVLSGKTGTLVREGNIQVEDIRFAKELLDELGMQEKYDRGFDTLSKGERQNILIARALFSKPDILILDEPCTGLDIKNRSHLFHTIEDLGIKKKMTIIYVTHYAEEILPLFQKTLLLKNGRVFAKGSTGDLMNSEVMSAFVDGNAVVTQDANQMYHIDVDVPSNIVHLWGED